MYLFVKCFVFFLMSYGGMKLFNINMEKLRKEAILLFSPSRESLSFKIALAKGKKKRGGLSKLIYETKEVLNLVGKSSEFSLVCFSAVVLTVSSTGFCIMANNWFLILPLGLIGIIAPFAYIRQKGVRLRRMINEELETALSVITNSYMRNENIIIAVEENVEYIHPPVKQIFVNFIFNCDYVSSDIRQNLRKLKGSLNNTVFQEWCNVLISCQNDSSLRHILIPIVKKLSYIRIVSVRLDSALYEPVREFVFMLIILFFNFPVFYVLNRQWYNILTQTVYGHFTIAMVTSIAVFCFINVLRLTRPIEYQR